MYFVSNHICFTLIIGTLYSNTDKSIIDNYVEKSNFRYICIFYNTMLIKLDTVVILYKYYLFISYNSHTNE